MITNTLAIRYTSVKPIVYKMNARGQQEAIQNKEATYIRTQSYVENLCSMEDNKIRDSLC